MEGAFSYEVARIFTEKFGTNQNAMWIQNEDGDIAALDTEHFETSQGWYDLLGNEKIRVLNLKGEAGQAGEIDTDEAVYVSKNDWQDLTSNDGPSSSSETLVEAWRRSAGGSLGTLRNMRSFSPLVDKGDGGGNMADDDTGIIFYGRSDGILRTGWVNESENKAAVMRTLGTPESLRYASQLDSMGTVATVMGWLVVLDVVITAAEVVVTVLTGGLGAPVAAGVGEGAKRGIAVGVRAATRFGAKKAVMMTMRKFGVQAAAGLAARMVAKEAGVSVLKRMAVNGVFRVALGASRRYTAKRIAAYAIVGGLVNAGLGTYTRGEFTMDALGDFAHGAFLFGIMSGKSAGVGKGTRSLLQTGLGRQAVGLAQAGSRLTGSVRFLPTLSTRTVLRAGIAASVFGIATGLAQGGSWVRGNGLMGAGDAMAVGALATALLLGGRGIASIGVKGSFQGTKQFAQSAVSSGSLWASVFAIVESTDMSADERDLQRRGKDQKPLTRFQRSVSAAGKGFGAGALFAVGMKGMGRAATGEGLSALQRAGIAMGTGAAVGTTGFVGYKALNNDTGENYLFTNQMYADAGKGAVGGALLGLFGLVALRAGSMSKEAVESGVAKAIKEGTLKEGRMAEFMFRVKNVAPATFGEMTLGGKAGSLAAFGVGGGAIKAGYGMYTKGDSYSWGQGTADFIGGAALGMLGLFMIRGAKNLDTLARFSDDTLAAGTRGGATAGAKGAEGLAAAAKGQGSAALSLWNASAMGAAKWAYISPAFTIGGALWTGISARVVEAIDGKDNQFRKSFGQDGRLPAFILASQGEDGEAAYMDMLTPAGLQSIYDSAITGPMHGLWMAPAFGTFQVLGGSARPSGFRGFLGKVLERAQKGPAGAGKAASTLYRDVFYMPALVTGTSTFIEFFGNGSSTVSLSALAKFIDDVVYDENKRPVYTRTREGADGETEEVEVLDRPEIFSKGETEAAGYAAFLAIPQIGARTAQLRARAGIAEKSGNLAEAQKLATEATRLDRFDMESWGVRLRSERAALNLAGGSTTEGGNVSMRTVAASHREFIAVAEAAKDSVMKTEAESQMNIFRADALVSNAYNANARATEFHTKAQESADPQQAQTFEIMAAKEIKIAERATTRARAANSENVDAYIAEAKTILVKAMMEGRLTTPETEAEIIGRYNQALALARSPQIKEQITSLMNVQQGRLAASRMIEGYNKIISMEAGQARTEAIARAEADRSIMKAKLPEGEYTADVKLAEAQLSRVKNGDKGFTEKDSITGRDIGGERFSTYERTMKKAFELAQAAGDAALAESIMGYLNGARFVRAAHEGFEAATEPGRNLELAFSKFGAARKYSDAVSVEAAAVAEKNFQVISQAIGTEQFVKPRLEASELGRIRAFEVNKAELAKLGDEASAEVRNAADATQKGYLGMLRGMGPEKASVLKASDFKAWSQLRRQGGNPVEMAQGLAEIAKALHLRLTGSKTGGGPEAVDRVVREMEALKGQAEGGSTRAPSRMEKDINAEIRDVRDYQATIPELNSPQRTARAEFFTEKQNAIIGRYNAAAEAYRGVKGKVSASSNLPVAMEYRAAAGEYRSLIRQMSSEQAARLDFGDYRRWRAYQDMSTPDSALRSSVKIAQAAHLRGDAATKDLMVKTLEGIRSEGAQSQKDALVQWMETTKPVRQSDLEKAGYETVEVASAKDLSSSLKPVKQPPASESSPEKIGQNNQPPDAAVLASGVGLRNVNAREGLLDAADAVNQRGSTVLARETGGESRTEKGFDLSRVIKDVSMREAGKEIGRDMRIPVWESKPYNGVKEAFDFAMLVGAVAKIMYEGNVLRNQPGASEKAVEATVQARITSVMEGYKAKSKPNNLRQAVEQAAGLYADQYMRAENSPLFDGNFKSFQPGREAQNEIISLFLNTINEMAMVEARPSLASSSRIVRILSAPTGAGKTVALALALDYLSRTQTAEGKTTLVALPTKEVLNDVKAMAQKLGVRTFEVGGEGATKSGADVRIAPGAINLATHSEAQQLILTGAIGKKGAIKNFRLLVDEVDEFIRLNDMREGDSSVEDVKFLRSEQGNPQQVKRELSLKARSEKLVEVMESMIDTMGMNGKIASPSAELVAVSDTGQVTVKSPELRARIIDAFSKKLGPGGLERFKSDLREITIETSQITDGKGNIVKKGVALNFETFVNEIAGNIRLGKRRAAYDPAPDSLTKVGTVERGVLQRNTTPESREQAMANALVALMRAAKSGEYDKATIETDSQIAFQLALRQKPATKIARASDVIGQADMVMGFSATARSAEFYLKQIEGADIRVVRSKDNTEIDSTKKADLVLLDTSRFTDIVGPGRDFRRQVASIEQDLLGRKDMNSDIVWVKIGKDSDGRTTLLPAEKGKEGAVPLNRSPMTGLLVQDLALMDAFSKSNVTLRGGEGGKIKIFAAEPSNKDSLTRAKNAVLRASSMELAIEIVQTTLKLQTAREVASKRNSTSADRARVET
ncbi:MAG: DEAD/DEAH box helicase, partial [Candidatus Omnitrophica bacterium]|nr:DEAD/DEAH box helicase [Candidatus Omnitrophota bacterium]